MPACMLQTLTWFWQVLPEQPHVQLELVIIPVVNTNCIWISEGGSHGHRQHNPDVCSDMWLSHRYTWRVTTWWKKTAAEPIPVKLYNGDTRERADMCTSHEEDDVIIVQLVVHLADPGNMSIRSVADDTDVFVILIHFYKLRQLVCNRVMIGLGDQV
jgi:hypothetical protein